MNDKEKRHKRARFYVLCLYGCIGCVLSGFLLDDLGMIVWGAIIGAIFFFCAALAGNDHIYEDPFDELTDGF